MQKGSTCALITPFKDDGEIDIPCLERLIEHHIEAGTDNLCVLGTTAEASVMTMDERALVLTKVANIAKGKIPLLVGTGSINPVSAKSMTQQAIDLGADASLLVNPYYVKPPQRCLITHFSSIADMGLPVVLYNVPGRTGSNIADETVATLSDHEYIIGIKDASGDLSRVASLKEALGDRNDDFLKYSGEDANMDEYILQGGDGCISVTANIVPGKVREMVHAALKGDRELTNKLSEPLRPLHKNLFLESNPIPTKWAAKRIGLINSAYCRPPLDEMDPQYADFVDEALKGVGLL